MDGNSIWKKYLHCSITAMLECMCINCSVSDIAFWNCSTARVQRVHAVDFCQCAWNIVYSVVNSPVQELVIDHCPSDWPQIDAGRRPSVTNDHNTPSFSWLSGKLHARSLRQYRHVTNESIGIDDGWNDVLSHPCSERVPGLQHISHNYP